MNSGSLLSMYDINCDINGREDGNIGKYVNELVAFGFCYLYLLFGFINFITNKVQCNLCKYPFLCT